MESKDLFNIEETIAKELIEKEKYPWQCLPRIHDFILELGKKLDKNNYNQIGEDIWIAKSAKVNESACIIGPTIIDENAEIRHSAYIRGNVIIGKNTVVGNSTELKNCILFNDVEVPHFNYVGDSILGHKAHMGAGAIASNLRVDKNNVMIIDKNNIIDTGLKKVGAFLGDNVQVGCNSVLNPGTIIGKNTIVYPLSSVKGVILENIIFKNKNKI